jgi:predicted O-methyltransferase YrrM
MKQFRFAYKFLIHFLTAKNTGGHGIHSPFCYQFTQSVLCDKSQYYIFPAIEELRSNLKNDNRQLNITDFGTGKDKTKAISEITTKSLKSAKYGQLLFKIANYFNSRNILELGTSLGLTTSYLASSSTEIRCVTIEGCPEILGVATENFRKLNMKNIETCQGNIDLKLTNVLDSFDKLDLIFIDANHRFPQIYNYFELCMTKIHSDSIIIIDDIYWSEDMEKAWLMIKKHPLVRTSIDLFHAGIVFFNPDLHKNHYKIRY